MGLVDVPQGFASPAAMTCRSRRAGLSAEEARGKYIAKANELAAKYA